MIVLLEGPDGGGKTTLGKRCESMSLSVKYQHNGPPPYVLPEDIFWWQLRALMPATPTEVTVVDRSWPSEQLYHRFAGRVNTFDRCAHRMFERYMLSVNGIVVKCLPPFEIAYRNWRARADAGLELLTKDEEFREMYDFYVLWRTILPTFTFDYTQHSMEAFIDATAEIAVAAKRDTPNPAPGTLVGNPLAPILVVGEQARNKPQPCLPYIAPGGTSRFITNVFEAMGIGEDNLAWVNALTPDGEVTDPGFVKELLADVVITLGSAAQIWATAHCPNRRIMSYRNPAVHRRFRPTEVFPLVHDAKYLHGVIYGADVHGR